MNNKLGDFKKIINFEISNRGDFNNLNYNPTFKASAIFFFICNEYIDTKISFLNYWNIKNHNKDVSCLITLRNNLGEKIFRTFFKIEYNTYTLSLNKIIKENTKIKNSVTGTIDVELFSSFDLKFIYPAIDAIYETSHGVSLVHSNQRILNDIKDKNTNISLNQTQTGFDIYCDKKNYSFIVAINGPLEIENKFLSVKFYNHKGKILHKNYKYNKIKPYEVINLNLDKIKSIKNFFEGKKGFCKINLPTENIFNRVLVGTMSRDNKKITTTHSYYDCSDIRDYVDFKKFNKKFYNCFIPFNMIEKIDLDIVIYPIFSKSNLTFDLEMFNKDGKYKLIKKDILILDKKFSNPVTININKFLKNIKNFSKNVYCLNIKSKDNKIPSRMTYGFNYKQVSFGSNISDAMVVNHGGITRRKKSKGFYWGPVFHTKKVSTIIALSSFEEFSKRNFQNIKLKIYDDKKIILKRKFKINSKEAKNIYLENLLKFKSENGKIFWFTLESSLSKSLICKHVHKSKYGHICADHSF